jgi:hypothetical protein
MSGKYITLDGKLTTPTDPNRGIWHGAKGCTFWTDDWAKLTSTESGIPCCPHCGVVGMQTTVQIWFDGAARFQSEGNPGYVNFIKDSQEQCKRPLSWIAWFRQWLVENPTGEISQPPKP